ncbi:MAG: hypothetical protein K5850_00680 [Bacteroidales bacterium]|nr:hypothetical protein [Bacteroidales bacterium]
MLILILTHGFQPFVRGAILNVLVEGQVPGTSCSAGYANQNLNLLMVDMPIVPATWFKGHIGHAAIHFAR